MVTRIGITFGDPAGIGPEIAQKAIQAIPPTLGIEYVLYDSTSNFQGPLNQPSAQSGQASLNALMRAIHDAQQNHIQAIVTAPISKEALHLAGSRHHGHTEILTQHLAKKPTAMAFFSETLRVVLTTTHVPLFKIHEHLTPQRFHDVLFLFHRTLQHQLNIHNPRIAIAGINPHAGENGLLGHEEQTILMPVIQHAQQQGLNVSHPIAPDVVFRLAREKQFDGVVAMYHDQALIPMKLYDFGDATHVTLGLQTIRTSPDHGTAFDIAHKNMASPKGMIRALQTAIKLTQKSQSSPKEMQ